MTATRTIKLVFLALALCAALFTISCRLVGSPALPGQGPAGQGAIKQEPANQGPAEATVTYTLYIPAIAPGEQITPTEQPVQVSCNDLIRNGNFDTTSGGRPWTGVANTSRTVYTPVFLSSVRAHSGSQSGRVGSPTVNGMWNEMIQTVQLPRGVSSVTLVYWRFLDTTETSLTKAYDIFEAGVETEQGIRIGAPQRIDNTSAGRGQWVKGTLALADPGAYSGKRLWVTFKGTTDSNLPSSLYVDDVQLVVCATGW